MAEPAQDSIELRAAVAAVQQQFMQLVMAGKECDMLCRVTSFTQMIYGSVEASSKDNDTPRKLSDRVKFVRGLGEEMATVHDTWLRTVQKYSRRTERVGSHIWYCPRCRRDDCSGTLPARLYNAEQGGLG